MTGVRYFLACFSEDLYGEKYGPTRLDRVVSIEIFDTDDNARAKERRKHVDLDASQECFDCVVHTDLCKIFVAT